MPALHDVIDSLKSTLSDERERSAGLQREVDRINNLLDTFREQNAIDAITIKNLTEQLSEACGDNLTWEMKTENLKMQITNLEVEVSKLTEQSQLPDDSGDDWPGKMETEIVEQNTHPNVEYVNALTFEIAEANSLVTVLAERNENLLDINAKCKADIDKNNAKIATIRATIDSICCDILISMCSGEEVAIADIEKLREAVK